MYVLPFIDFSSTNYAPFVLLADNISHFFLWVGARGSNNWCWYDLDGLDLSRVSGVADGSVAMVTGQSAGLALSITVRVVFVLGIMCIRYSS